MFLRLEDREERFYLPTIVTTDPNDGVALAHELCHVRDLLALIARDPGYPARAERFAGPLDAANLAAHIDFVLFRTFVLEPRAYALEHAMGLTMISFGAGLDPRLRLRARSHDDFVQVCVSECVAMFERSFLGALPSRAEEIQAQVRAGVDRYGRGVFGPTPSLTHARIQAEIPLRLVEQVRSEGMGTVRAVAASLARVAAERHAAASTSR